MKKFITAILTIAMLASLAGCNSENEPSDSNYSSEISNTISDNNSEPAESTPEVDKGEPTFLMGLDGEPIYTSEITAFLDIDRSEITVDNITPGGFNYAICEGFCYLSEPSGLSKSMAANFNDLYAPSGHVPEYKRVNVGDTFCGLTVKNASVEFFGKETDNYFTSNVEFEGELTLTGYITINHDFDYAVGDGDLQFLIDDKSAVLPGCCTNSLGDYSTNYQRCGYYMENGTSEPVFYWCVNEYGLIYLGNINTVTADISDIGNRDMCYYKVQVKIKDPKIGYYPELSNGDYLYFADLVELEAID